MCWLQMYDHCGYDGECTTWFDWQRSAACGAIACTQEERTITRVEKEHASGDARVVESDWAFWHRIGTDGLRSLPLERHEAELKLRT